MLNSQLITCCDDEFVHQIINKLHNVTVYDTLIAKYAKEASLCGENTIPSYKVKVKTAWQSNSQWLQYEKQTNIGFQFKKIPTGIPNASTKNIVANVKRKSCLFSRIFNSLKTLSLWRWTFRQKPSKCFIPHDKRIDKNTTWRDKLLSMYMNKCIYNSYKKGRKIHFCTSAFHAIYSLFPYYKVWWILMWLRAT